jgi:TonB family protein
MKRISLFFLVFLIVAGAPALSVAETETTETEIDKSVELEFWQNVKDSDNEDMLRAYLEHYPNGNFKSLAEIKIKQLAGTEVEVVTSSTSISEEQQVTTPSVPLSVLTRGLDAFYKEDYQGAYHILAPLAEAGEPQAQVRVARMLLEGRGTNRAKLGAIAMFTDALPPIQAAAGEGIPWAQSDLADYFVDGLLFAQDLSKAAFWYRKAADQGYAPAQTNLGWLSFDGYDEVAPNRAVAVHWFREAAAQGNPAAVRNLQALGESLLDRPGVTTEDPGDDEETVPSDTQNQRDEADALVAFGSVAWAIKEEVRTNWNPPAGDFEGFSVLFTIRVDREGNVTSVAMMRGSGNARFDESAENAIYKASPLPIPAEPRFYEYLKEFQFQFMP